MILIDLKDSRPIYEQVVERFKILILRGAIEPDEKLPGLLADLRSGGFENLILVDDGSGEAYRHFLNRPGGSLAAGFCTMR